MIEKRIKFSVISFLLFSTYINFDIKLTANTQIRLFYIDSNMTESLLSLFCVILIDNKYFLIKSKIFTLK